MLFGRGRVLFDEEKVVQPFFPLCSTDVLGSGEKGIYLVEGAGQDKK